MKYIISESQLKKILEQIDLLGGGLNPILGVLDFVGLGGKSETIFPGCSSTVIKAKDWKELYNTLTSNGMVKKGENLLIVWGPSQTAFYTSDGVNATKTFKVSTGLGGFGNTVDQKQTPPGLLKVDGKKIADKYEVLVYKSPTGTILGPNVTSTRVDEKGEQHQAEVLTAILELTGLEECNKNAFSRNIYFHGTNREAKLGTKASGGCIRVSNNDILWLTNNLPVGTKVYIKP